MPSLIASSTPLTNRTESSVLKRARQLQRLVQHDGRRRVGLVPQFPDRQPQDQPIDDGQPLEPPVLTNAARSGRPASRSRPSCRPRAGARTRAPGPRASGMVFRKDSLQGRAGGTPPTSQSRESAGPPRAPGAAARSCLRRSRRGVPPQPLVKAGHLDRRRGRFPALVGRSLAGARQRLLGRVRRQHAERDRHTGRLRGAR